MTRHDRRLDRLRSIPADFKWSELVTVLEHLGYTLEKGSGSRRKFWRDDHLAPISMHEPHNNAPIGRTALRYVVETLTDASLI